MKLFTSKTQKIGELGEELACKYLVKQGHKILERNFTTKVGEIDIITQKDLSVYFFEVKSAKTSLLHSRTTGSHNFIDYKQKNVASGPYIAPEENFHKHKQRKFLKTIEMYCAYKKVSYETTKASLLVVYIDLENLKSKIKMYDVVS